MLQVVEVGHFWGFQADEASLEKQRHLTTEINMRTLHPVTVSLYPNLLCLAPYSEINEQGMYYRAKILHMRGNTVEVTIAHTLSFFGAPYNNLLYYYCQILFLYQHLFLIMP